MNHSNQLAIVDGNEVFTIDEQTELEKHIDHVIAAHKNNRQEINRLVFECTSALTAADDASHELASKGFFSRFIGAITGSNKRLQDKINRNTRAAQYASQVTMQKLAEQNLMTFDLLTAVNNKLNASIDAVNEKFKEQFVILGKFILKTRGDMISLSLRMDKAEWNVKLLNWQASVESLKLNGVEYSDLDDTGKIVCLARDFYDLTGGNWTTSDLLLLKAAMGQIGMAPKKEINIFDTLKTIADTLVLQEKLLNHNGIKPISDPSYLISMGTLEKLNALADKDRYMVDVVAANYKNHGVTMGADEIRGDLAKGYMRQQANVNLNTNVGAYDFMLDLLYNLSESAAEGLLQLKSESKAEGALQCKDDKDLMHLFLTDHTEKAYEQIREAADEGNAIALYMMAAYFSQGYGVQPINNQKAIAYFKKSYEAGYAVAGYDVAASLPDGSPEQDEIRKNAKDKILELSNEGDVFAQANVAWGYRKGYDNLEAVKWYQKAAEQGLAIAQYKLGTMYEKGRGVEPSDEKAVEWFQKAAEQGLADAQCKLGFMYRNGTGVEQSYAKAAKWFQKAAGQGLADAQYHLGRMYQNGTGVERSYEKAAKWFQKAAEQGYDRAQRVLVLMYRNGTGVERSYAKALEWWQKAAEQGYDWAQRVLGLMYLNGDGVEQSDAKALEWFQKAAEQGFDAAQYNLGRMYENLGRMYEFGDGVEQSDEKAAGWYLKAAEQGLADAQNQLGRMYENGRGVERSYEKAAGWYLKAAEQGNAHAQYKLGDMYAKGRGVEQSYEKAVEWYQKAAGQRFVLSNSDPM
ncbi:FOG: TPR repeat%2C SEL1 subfamily [Bacteroides xylanisolvens]|nr:FOG: TPR repeat%2C SEL1 subfamily [Bacteroides xylanisolvens]